MRKSIEQCIYSVKEQLSGFIVTDDNNISDLMIHRKLLDVKSVVLKDEYNRNKFLDPNLFMSECCLEIKCRNILCDGIDSGEIEYYVDLPAVESFLGETAIKYLGGVDKRSPFAMRSFSGQMFSEFNNFTHSVVTATRIDNRATIKNLPTSGMKFVCFVAIFEDPISFCKPTDPFPLPQHLIQQMELLTIKHIATGFSMIPDSKNDASGQPELAVPVKTTDT